MLLSFEEKANTQRKVLLVLVYYSWSFIYKDSNIQCFRHIINLAI
jgi:hypothetical protein